MKKKTASGKRRLFYILLLSVVLMSSPAQYLSLRPDHGDEDGSVPGVYLAETTFDYSYIAIGPEDFRDTMEPLINWKTKKGVRARYFDLDGEDNILAWNGTDVQEKVRNFIKHVYNNSILEESPGGGTGDPVLKWVLLVGDGEIIPTRRIFVNGEYTPEEDVPENFVHTDMYYASLARTWDDNGNGIYGEEGPTVDDETDWKAEVYVGRFPASNREELRIMVDRQLNYERDPPPGDWTSSMLLTGSAMDAPNSRTYWDPYKDNAYELVRRIEGNLPENVTPFHLVDYPRQEYGGYNQMFDTLNRSTFRSYYEMGFSTAVLACHGDKNGNCTEYKGDSGGVERWYYDMGIFFDYEMAENINNSFRTPLVYISNCDSLNFTEEDDTNMERLMRNPDGGAIGLIGASVTTYRGEYKPGYFEKDSFGNWWLAEEYFRVLYNETPRPGEALYRQKFNHWIHIFDGYSPYPIELRMFRIDNLAYSLLGDPEGQIWLDVPGRITTEADDPFYLSNGSMVMTIRDEYSGEVIPNATVTLSSRNGFDFYITNKTDSRGKVHIPLELTDPGTLDLVVTGDGYLPLERDIDVISVSNLKIDNEIELEPEYPTTGHPFKAKVNVENDGITDLYGIKIEFRLIPIDQNEGETRTRVKTIERLESGKSRIVQFDSESFWGRNRIEMDSLVPGIIERTIDDNRVKLTFMTNEPMEKPGDITIRLPEDTPLSEYSGKIDLSNHVPDDAYPEPNSAEIWEVEGGFDVVEKDMRVNIDPHNDWYGEGWFTVNITDTALSTTMKINVNITPVADPPEFLDPPRRIQAVEDRISYVEMKLKDPDSEELSIIADLPEFKAREVRKDGHVFNISFVPDEDMVGESFVNITARDEEGNTRNHSISIGVNSTNDPPVVEPEKYVYNISSGNRVRINLNIVDTDSKQEFRILAESSLFNPLILENTTVIAFDVPASVREGEYPVEITVFDEMNASTELSVTVRVREKGDEPVNYLVLLVGVLVLLVIILTGVFINLQERKQKNILKDVGTESPLEAKSLSEEDFESRPDSETILMPPIPSNTEGELARKEREGREEDEDIEINPEGDMDSDIDDVISEIFPGR